MSPAEGRLSGRVGLITGAASGIGAAGASLFAAHGAALVLVDTDATGGERTASAITARGGRGVFAHGDAASAADISRAVRLAVDRFGKLDLLWANAGVGVAKTVPQMSLEEWTRVIDVNLTGAFLLAKFGIPELAAAGGGLRMRGMPSETVCTPTTRPGTPGSAASARISFKNESSRA